MDKPRIVIKMEGGLIQEIGSDQPVTVLLLDYDIEGADEEDLITVDGEQCSPTQWDLGEEKSFVERNWVELPEGK